MTAAMPFYGPDPAVRAETAAWLASAALSELPGLAGVMRRTADVPDVLVQAARDALTARMAA